MFVTEIVEGNSSHGMKVYPSPSDGTFSVSLSGMKQRVELRLLDLTGQVIYKTIVSGNIETKLERNLAPGVYFIQVKENSNILTQKLIIR